MVRSIEEVLSDAPRSGRPPTDEAIKRKIVDGISVSQVGRYLDETALQPHRTKYWLNTKEKDPVKFQS